MGKFPSCGVTVGKRPKPILVEGRRRVRRCLRSDDRPTWFPWVGRGRDL